mgnify:CR=1 FL=1
MKRRLGYRGRLFLSVLILVWVIIGILLGYQYYNEVSFRQELVRSELSMIDSRVIYAYERNVDIPGFVKFLGPYYANTLYSDVRVSVYNDKDSLIAVKGEPLPLEHKSLNTSTTSEQGAVVGDIDESEIFYFTACKSNDGKVQVRTAMPYTISLRYAMFVDENLGWIFLVITLLATITVYFSTRYISRNIMLLRNFVRDLSHGKGNVEISKIPHDEIGEIAREIINLYEGRIRAMEQSDREHRIAIDAIEENANMRRQMTSNINHELKTPIGVIRGYLETIADNPDMDDDTRNHFLVRARDNVERLCSLLNDVSTMTRLEEGTEKVPIASVNMYELLESVSADATASHTCGDMTFNFWLPKDCNVLGHHNLLSGLILNLIRNAVFHSHGTAMEFRVVAESEKHYIFAFLDNGTGVGEEHLEHLFERFYRIDSGRSRKVGGTGLGLPIVKSTIEALGGSISVFNRATGGLAFLFSLKKS